MGANGEVQEEDTGCLGSGLFANCQNCIERMVSSRAGCRKETLQLCVKGLTSKEPWVSDKFDIDRSGFQSYSSVFTSQLPLTSKNYYPQFQYAIGQKN